MNDGELKEAERIFQHWMRAHPEATLAESIREYANTIYEYGKCQGFLNAGDILLEHQKKHHAKGSRAREQAIKLAKDDVYAIGGKFDKRDW